MKKSIKILLAVALALVLTVSVICVSAFASGEEQTPNLQITACTLSFDDSVYIMYALPIDSTAGAEVKMLYFTEAQDTLDEYNYENAKYRESHIGIQNALGKDSYVYKNKHMNAKNMTDVVYARAYAKVGDTEYYSNLVKYSILEYAYNTLASIPETNPTAKQLKLKELLETMLSYGAASQKYFNYNLENLATDEYFKISVVGGHFEDTATKGFYKKGSEITLIATADGEEYNIIWENSEGKSVGTGKTITLPEISSNETYTAKNSKYSVGLEYELNVDGESYSVIAMGDCQDSELIIPDTYEGKPVTAIADLAFFRERYIVKVIIPDSVKSIGEDSFTSCASLTSVVLGKGIESIADWAFDRSYELTTVYYCGSKEQWQTVAVGEENSEIVSSPKIYSEGNPTDSCESYWSYVNGVPTVYKHTEVIDEAVEPDCENTGLTEGSHCSSCNEIIVAQAVIDALGHTEVVDEAVEADCENSGLTEGSHCGVCGKIFVEQTVVDASGHSYENGQNGECANCGEFKGSEGLRFLLNEDGESYSVDGIGVCTDTDVYVPAEYKGKPVTKIGYSAFEYCDKITSIILPDSVVSIEAYAFSHCDNLTSVTLGGGVTSIKDHVFYYSAEINEIVIPESCNFIGNNAFYGTSLTSAVFEDAEGWSLANPKAALTSISGLGVGSSSYVKKYFDENFGFKWNSYNFTDGSYRKYTIRSHDTMLVSSENGDLNAKALTALFVIETSYVENAYYSPNYITIEAKYYASDWVRS